VSVRVGVIGLGVHRLDLALCFVGYPRVLSVSVSASVGAELAREMGLQYDVEDLAVALIRLDNGVTLNFEVSWGGGTCRRENMLAGIYGQNGAGVT